MPSASALAATKASPASPPQESWRSRASDWYPSVPSSKPAPSRAPRLFMKTPRALKMRSGLNGSPSAMCRAISAATVLKRESAAARPAASRMPRWRRGRPRRSWPQPP